MNWWVQVGGEFAERVRAKLVGLSVGTLSEAMMDGTKLSDMEVTQVVTDSKFPDFEKAMHTGDYAQAAALIAGPDGFATKMTRAWIFFRRTSSSSASSAAKAAAKDDYDRPRLDAALLRMTKLWEGELESIVASRYPNRASYPPDFLQTLHVALSTFTGKHAFSHGLEVAMSLLVGTPALSECGSDKIRKAVSAAMAVLHGMFPGRVGRAAPQLAADILEIWSDADQSFGQYRQFYDGKASPPLDIIQRFIEPLLDEWATAQWKLLRGESGDSMLLASKLTRKNMLAHPEWGLNLLIERANSVCGGGNGKGGTGGKGADYKGGRDTKEGDYGGGGSGDHRIRCNHCGLPGHKAAKCYKAHPHLRPGSNEFREHKRQKAGNTYTQQQGMALATGAQGAASPAAFFQQLQQLMQSPTQSPMLTTIQSPTPAVKRPPLPGGLPPSAAAAAATAAGYVARSQRICFECGEKGHMSRDCPRK